jgi:hypothetical protein
VVCAPPGAWARRLLEMSGLDEVLRIAGTVDDAVMSVAAEPAG